MSSAVNSVDSVPVVVTRPSAKKYIIWGAVILVILILIIIALLIWYFYEKKKNATAASAAAAAASTNPPSTTPASTATPATGTPVTTGASGSGLTSAPQPTTDTAVVSFLDGTNTTLGPGSYAASAFEGPVTGINLGTNLIIATMSGVQSGNGYGAASLTGNVPYGSANPVTVANMTINKINTQLNEIGSPLRKGLEVGTRYSRRK